VIVPIFKINAQHSLEWLILDTSGKTDFIRVSRGHFSIILDKISTPIFTGDYYFTFKLDK
jgi:hypothetical protein